MNSSSVQAIAKQSRLAARQLSSTSESLRNLALSKMVDSLQSAKRRVLEVKKARQAEQSRHTDAIVTQSLNMAQQFEPQVDSGSVLINASTRLSGGGDYGLGSVVGISTDKLNARSPVGPDELTTYKWLAYGNASPMLAMPLPQTPPLQTLLQFEARKQNSVTSLTKLKAVLALGFGRR